MTYARLASPDRKVPRGRRARARSGSAVEATHLLHRGTQVVARELRVLDEAVALLADLGAAPVDDRHPVRLDQRIVVVADRDEPVPLRLGEEAVPARVVGGRIGAAEHTGY